ncbi:MAG: T9SS type A sorting domain-containing protein [Saprospiraceae bacterium]|nr:T9SS type A sorting domain-containing protein [Saprospiraceae bacterium]MCF8248583.1 T9SS type A sorting domain-containing protein [Saprospiraceae bacterium]MCF8280250.1 T9SS type A sorting domain-containing protein [Bacteroidales bacterium]MCF8310316.1 T9SS type A sorting domain-containing protein [Saprospiraceae bacterium]MCF8439244.1 T9SS type A sorting domain-containing protein [Saprospiraceae bacterium]
MTERMVVNIPVVVHVVWNSSVENISNEQILSQIDVLNEDFSAGNIQIGGIPAIFQALIADVGFHFCLASKDPSGNSTTGITRTQTSNNIGIGGTSAIHHSSQGGHDAWNPDKYLNIWVAKFAGGIGGVGSFPGEGPADEQGIEINYKQFGTFGTATNPPYHLGRTCTHEVGHYFNLNHLWGPSANSCCNEDDGVADTPVSCEDYLSECPSGTTFSCTAPDMWMNFMNYTDDACMAMFSLGQKLRMYDALNNFRAGLLNSDGCQAVATEEQAVGTELRILGNPVRAQLNLEIRSQTGSPWKLELVNMLGIPVFCEAKMANAPVSIDCQPFPRGIYFLVASQNETRIVKRVILI